MQKGQMTIIGIIMVLITVMIFSAIVPVMVDSINNATAVTDDATDVVLNLIPFMCAIALVITIFTYARPYAERLRGE